MPYEPDVLRVKAVVLKNAVDSLETQLKNKTDFHDEGLVASQNSWLDRIEQFEIQVERIKADYQKETEALILNYENEWKLDLIEAELKVPEKALIEYESSLIDTELKIKTTRDTLHELKNEIKAHPRMLVVSKAVTDEALWIRLGDEEGNLPDTLEEQKLRSEVLNPVHSRLKDRLASTQIELNSLAPMKEHLASQISRAREEIQRLEDLYTEKSIELNALTQDRKLGYEVLVKEKQGQLGKLNRRFELEVRQFKRDRDLELGILGREVTNTRATYTLLAQKYTTARLAKAEEEPDVKIGALAVVPEERTPTLGWIAALGFATGLILSLIVVLAVEILTVEKASRLAGEGAGSYAS